MNYHSQAKRYAADQHLGDHLQQELQTHKFPVASTDISEPISLVTADSKSNSTPRPSAHLKPIQHEGQPQDTFNRFNNNNNESSSSISTANMSVIDFDKYLYATDVSDVYKYVQQMRRAMQTDISVDMESLRLSSDRTHQLLQDAPIYETTYPTFTPPPSLQMYQGSSSSVPHLVLEGKEHLVPEEKDSQEQQQQQQQLEPALTETNLMCVAAQALAQTLHPSRDEVISDEVYEKFITLMVDCAPLVRPDHQTVMTSLLRRTSHILNVTTIFPWHHRNPTPPTQTDTPKTSIEPNDTLTTSVLLLGLFPSSSTTRTQPDHHRKRRALRRALVLAAAPCSKHASDSIDHSIVVIQVMMSFSLTVTTALAAFARLLCDITLTQFVKEDSNAEFSVRLSNSDTRLSFAVSFSGDAPCSVRFHTPGILALRQMGKFTAIVKQVRGLIEEFEREVLMWECSRTSKSMSASLSSGTRSQVSTLLNTGSKSFGESSDEHR